MNPELTSPNPIESAEDLRSADLIKFVEKYGVGTIADRCGFPVWASNFRTGGNLDLLCTTIQAVAGLPVRAPDPHAGGYCWCAECSTRAITKDIVFKDGYSPLEKWELRAGHPIPTTEQLLQRNKDSWNDIVFKHQLGDPRIQIACPSCGRTGEVAQAWDGTQRFWRKEERDPDLNLFYKTMYLTVPLGFKAPSPEINEIAIEVLRGEHTEPGDNSRASLHIHHPWIGSLITAVVLNQRWANEGTISMRKDIKTKLERIMNPPELPTQLSPYLKKIDPLFGQLNLRQQELRCRELIAELEREHRKALADPRVACLIILSRRLLSQYERLSQ